MGRLLRRSGDCIERVCHYGHENRCYDCADRTKCNADIFDRLAHYEDLAEQGRLVILGKMKDGAMETEDDLTSGSDFYESISAHEIEAALANASDVPEGGGSMKIDTAMKRLEKEYERAKNLEFVRNPVAYALYQVWKEADREDQPPQEG